MSSPLSLVVAGLAGIAVTFALAACGGDQPAGATAAPTVTISDRPVHQVPAGTTLKLAFITNNSSEFWKIAQKGVEKADAELGVKTEIKLPETGKPEQQKKIIEDLIAQGYHGLAISLISPADQTRDIDKATAKLNVITHDSDGPESKRLAYIGTNNYEAGRVLGNELKKLLPDGGKVAAFVGTLAADNASQRLKGVKDALAGSRIEVVMAKEDNKDMTKARTNVEDVINANPEVTAFIGLWSYNTPQIVAAVKASGKAAQLTIAGFDEEEPTLQAIEEGLVKATVVQKPFEFGYRSVKLLHALATTGATALPKDPIIDTGVDVVTKDNVAAFKAKLADLKK
jgi:ribose transport system substrate-binding protein